MLQHYEIQKQIQFDWLQSFNQLNSYKYNKLYKKAGCILIGLELILVPNASLYRPHFVIYPLWKEDVPKCLEKPLVMKQLYNSKMMQYDIPIQKHSILLEDAVNCIKKQISISMFGDVELNKIIQFADSNFNDLLVKSNAANQAKLFELQFFCAVYTNNLEVANNVLLQILNVRNSWDAKQLQLFEYWKGSFDEWIESLKTNILNQDELVRKVAQNGADKKLSNLLSFKIYEN